MAKQMNWQRARLVGRPSLDFRREFEFEDRASRWLRVVDRNQRQRREYVPPRSRITLTSSAEAPR
jgi:hypothetical protein